MSALQHIPRTCADSLCNVNLAAALRIFLPTEAAGLIPTELLAAALGALQSLQRILVLGQDLLRWLRKTQSPPVCIHLCMLINQR